ncbi:hypothetical protein V8F20_005954 [Naviculisporaceae sp. PSN 640]
MKTAGTKSSRGASAGKVRPAAKNFTARVTKRTTKTKGKKTPTAAAANAAYAKAQAKGKAKAKKSSAAAAPVPSTTTDAPGPSVAKLTEEVKNLKDRLASLEEELSRRVDNVDTQVWRLAKRVNQTTPAPLASAANFQGQANAAAAPAPEMFAPCTPPAQTRNRLGLTIQTNLPFPPTPESATGDDYCPCTSCTLRASPTPAFAAASGPYDPDHVFSPGRSATLALDSSTSELFVTPSFPELLAYELGPLVAPEFEQIPRRVHMVLIINSIPIDAWAMETDEVIATRCNQRLEDANWVLIIRTLRYIYVKGGFLDDITGEWIAAGPFVLWEEDLDEDFLNGYN